MEAIALFTLSFILIINHFRICRMRKEIDHLNQYIKAVHNYVKDIDMTQTAQNNGIIELYLYEALKREDYRKADEITKYFKKNNIKQTYQN